MHGSAGILDNLYCAGVKRKGTPEGLQERNIVETQTVVNFAAITPYISGYEGFSASLTSLKVRIVDLSISNSREWIVPAGLSFSHVIWHKGKEALT